MARYAQCPHCGNNENGYKIYRCNYSQKFWCSNNVDEIMDHRGSQVMEKLISCRGESFIYMYFVKIDDKTYSKGCPCCDDDDSFAFTFVGTIERNGYNNSDNGGKIYSCCPNCGSVHNKDNDAYCLERFGEIHYYSVCRCKRCNNVSCAHCWDGDGKYSNDNTRCPHCGQPTKDGQWIILGEIK